MKQSFRANLSANTVQLCINQAFSMAVFYFLSKGLSKADFGELNWTLAIFLTAFALLSFGLDQIIIKKIAAGEDRPVLLSLHFFHAAVAGFLFYAALFILLILFPSFFSHHQLLLLVGAGKLLLFFSTPFKALAAGAERFRTMLYMSVSATLIKGLCVGVLFFENKISLALIVPVFVLADASELAFGFMLSRKILKTPFARFPRWKAYRNFIKEAFPQLGIVLFSSALARVDWILIGFFLSAFKLAEYSFAYKAFEAASLPLLVIAPLLLPYFTRLVKEGRSLGQNESVQLLLRAEMVIACLAALCLNVIWNPVIDGITGGKYGSVNTRTVFILSMALPVLYLNNFLWTVHFAHGNMKLIFRSFVLSFFVNVFANFLLIPLYQNEGAALSYLLSVSVQTIFYLLYQKEEKIIGWQSLLFCSFCALCSGILYKYSSLQAVWMLPLCVALYLFLLLCTVQLRRADWQTFKQVLKA